MKKCAVVLLLAVLLCGCSTDHTELDRAMAFRGKLLAASGCTFDAQVTADYGESIYTFVMSCRGDGDGNLDFSVSEPETIRGITGRITAKEGKLTFDDKALAFSLLADDQLTPVSAPWLLLKCLRGGCVVSCGEEDEYLRLRIDEGYEESVLRGDIWLNRDDLPVRGDFLWNDRRILSVEISSFTLL